MKNGICPKCNSQAIIKNKRIPERGHYNAINFLSFTVWEKNKNWLYPYTPIATGEIRAWICGKCGYTELYTTNCKELFEAEQESKISNKK